MNKGLKKKSDVSLPQIKKFSLKNILGLLFQFSVRFQVSKCLKGKALLEINSHR